MGQAEAIMKCFAILADIPLETSDTCERLTLTLLFSFPLTIWTDAQLEHPLYPKGPWSGEDASRTTRLQTLRGHLQRISAALFQQGLPHIAHYLLTLESELLLATGDSSFLPTIRRIRDMYHIAGDNHGAARAMMIEADAMLSHPFTNPIAMNLIAIDSDDIGSTNNTWDSTESNMNFQSDNDARRLYEEGLGLLDDSESPHLMAAILLRQACVMHIDKLGHSSAMQQATYDDILLILHRAENLAHGNDSLLLLTRAHELLLNLSHSKFDGTLETAADIGVRALELQNEAIAEFLAALLVRFGRRHWLVWQNAKVAVQCYRCAGQCYQALCDDFGTLQARMCEFEIYQAMCDFSTTTRMVEDTKPMLYNVLTLLDDMKAAADSRIDYSLLRKNVIQTYDSRIRNALRDAGAETALKIWAAQLEILESDHSMQTAVRETLKNDHILTYVLGVTSDKQTRLRLVENQLNDERLFDKFYHVNQGYQEALDASDIARAEALLTEFVNSLEATESSVFAKTCLYVQAYFQLGQTAKAFAVLDSVADNDIIDDRLEEQKTELANSRDRLFRNPENLESVVPLFAMAQAWERGEQLLSRLMTLSSGYLDTSSCHHSPDMWLRFGWAGIILEHGRQYMKAFDLLFFATQALEKFWAQITDVDARQRTYSILTAAEIFGSLIRICLRCAESNIPIAVLSPSFGNYRTWLEMALHFQTQAKARSLLDTLQSSESSHDGPVKDLENAVALRRRANILNMLEQKDRTTEEDNELQHLHDQIGVGQDGLDAVTSSLFSASTDFEPCDLYSAIGPTTLVVDASFTRFGSVLTCVTSAGIQLMKPLEIRDVDIRQNIMRVTKALRSFTCCDRRAIEEDLAENLRSISAVLLEPIKHFIKEAKHIVFTASQPFAGFPLSALPLGPEPLCTQAAVSFVPSLATFIHLAKRTRTEGKHGLTSVIVKSAGLQDLAAVEAETPLPMAAIEGISIAQIFDSWPVKAGEVDRRRFEELLCNSNVLFIGSHGHLDTRSPWLSYISLEQRLRVQDLFHMRARAQLIVFAACLTGLGKATFSNDVLGFAHSMLATGCDCFIGALWEVDDVCTMLLMVTFAKALHQGNRTVAECWQLAQMTMYSLDKEGATRMITEISDGLDAAKRAGRKPESLIHKGKWLLKRALEGLPQDFKSPFYFASFSLIGLGQS
jgi:CHAT domain-containing protein